MAIVYLVIIWAYESGREWLGFSVWVTAFSVCLVIGTASRKIVSGPLPERDGTG
jgi:hypothetical protein